MSSLTIKLCVLALCASLAGCATKASAPSYSRKVAARFPVKEPPAPAEGRVTPIFAPQNKDEQACFDRLGLPAEPSYAFSEEKATACADLRLWANEAYRDALYNQNVCSIEIEVRDDLIVKQEASIKAYTDAEATWWHQNKSTVFFVSGWVLGAVMTTVVVYGIRD
jgi:hypothetical protein